MRAPLREINFQKSAKFAEDRWKNKPEKSRNMKTMRFYLYTLTHSREAVEGGK